MTERTGTAERRSDTAPGRGSPVGTPRTTHPAGRARFVDNYLGYLLGQANHALYKEFDAQVRAAGLTSIEWRVLATLHDSAPLTISQLAQEVLSKQPTVTKLVQRMSEQGWLDLHADRIDQRRTLVSATPSGKRLVKPLVRQALQHEARTLRFLEAGERAVLRQLLDKLRGTSDGA